MLNLLPDHVANCFGYRHIDTGTQPFGIGAKMLCLQGTSFTFVGVIITIGLSVREAGGVDRPTEFDLRLVHSRFALALLTRSSQN